MLIKAQSFGLRWSLWHSAEKFIIKKQVEVRHPQIPLFQCDLSVQVHNGKAPLSSVIVGPENYQLNVEPQGMMYKMQQSHKEQWQVWGLLYESLA